MAVHDVPAGAREDDGSPEPAAAPRRRRTRRYVVIGAVVVLLVAAYITAAVLVGDRVARGTTVAGVPVGGLTTAAAQDRLETELGEASTRPVTVVLGELETDLDPQAAGLELDAAATANRLTRFSLDPRDLLAHLTGGREVAPVRQVDGDALDEALRSAGESLEVTPVEGDIDFEDGEAQVTEAEDGLALDVDRAADPVREGWLTTSGPISLPGFDVAPEITAEMVATALDDVVGPLTAGPVAVEAGEHEVALEVADLLGVSAMEAQDGALVLELDEEALLELVLERSPDVRARATDARIVFEDDAPVVRPGSRGQDIDAEDLGEKVLLAALSTDERRAEVALVEVDPEFTTAAAEELGVDEVVASFDTPFFRDPPRTDNLRRGAEQITNTLIKPGETFSLIDTLSPITAENGYSAAGIVVDGRETEGLGGGLSQVSTTTFNAAYFAGMEIVTSQPHSHHYERYPEGREATIFTPSVDLQWKNTTPHGALMKSWVADGRFHVQVWGTEHYEVSSNTSDRYSFTSPTTVRYSGGDCVPNSNPSRGFTVDVTRTVSHDGTEVGRRTWTTTYVPWDTVVCE